MKNEKIWHCDRCHELDCSERKFNAAPNHIPYRGVDIGECKGIMKEYIEKEVVRQAIDKVIPLDENCATNMILNNQLKKELGLE